MNGGRKIVIFNFLGEDDDFIDGNDSERALPKRGSNIKGTALGLHPSDKEFKVWAHGVDPSQPPDPWVQYHLRS